MSATPSPGSEDTLRFENPEEVANSIEVALKRRYGRGVFIDTYRQANDDTIYIQVGNTVPKNVSDCRDRDAVLKFIEFAPIYTLKAEPVPNGYVLPLPDRDDLYEGFTAKRQELARKLDRQMARTIYGKIVTFPAVQNQLAGIRDILRTVRDHGPIARSVVHEVRGEEHRETTEQYLDLLDDTGFIRQEGGADEKTLYPGEFLDAYDINQVSSSDFDEEILGHVINRAYNTLRDELNLTLLAHYPKYATSYYFSSIQRGDPSLKLDANAATENLATLHDESVHPIKTEQKLDDLTRAGVIEKDDGFYKGNPAVYNQLAKHHQ